MGSNAINKLLPEFNEWIQKGVDKANEMMKEIQKNKGKNDE